MQLLYPWVSYSRSENTQYYYWWIFFSHFTGKNHPRDVARPLCKTWTSATRQECVCMKRKSHVCQQVVKFTVYWKPQMNQTKPQSKDIRFGHCFCILKLQVCQYPWSFCYSLIVKFRSASPLTQQNLQNLLLLCFVILFISMCIQGPILWNHLVKY